MRASGSGNNERARTRVQKRAWFAELEPIIHNRWEAGTPTEMPRNRHFAALNGVSETYAALVAQAALADLVV